MNIKTILITLLICVSAMSVIPATVSAQTLKDIEYQILIGGNDDDEEESDTKTAGDLEEEIANLENKISKLQSQTQTLQREIDQFDSEIRLTELKIQQARASIAEKEKEIEKLAGDIDDLQKRIEKLKDAIGFQEGVLSERLRARYKSQETSPLFVIFGSSTLNKVIQKTEYLKVMERQDKKLIDKMRETKKAFNLQKTLFEEKKEEEEVLKAELETKRNQFVTYNNQLEQQKAEKNNLLKVTQNDEQKYQDLLAEAKKELQQIVGAVSVLKDQAPRDVSKGEVIGYQGNTGYSSGEHLHFGVYRYSSFEDIVGWNWYYNNSVNPKKVLKSKNVYWHTGCESSGWTTHGEGDWNWPIGSPTVSQGYGHTCWSDSFYGGNDHPAYDMYGAVAAPVYAAEKGKAYFCVNCLGDGGNGVFIFHDDDYMSIYWHLR